MPRLSICNPNYKGRYIRNPFWPDDYIDIKWVQKNLPVSWIVSLEISRAYGVALRSVCESNSFIRVVIAFRTMIVAIERLLCK